MPRKLLVLCFLLVMATLPTQASSLLPLGLGEIIDGAQVGFHGICIANRSERDAQTGLIVTYTDFRVTDVLIGSVGTTHTIKQIGGQAGNEAYEVHGVPSFSAGQEYVVFLYGVSSAGFSSPVGLSQGQFVVRAGTTGAEISNGRDFKELLRGQTSSSIPQAVADRVHDTPGELRHLNLDEFKQLVRRHRSGAQ